MLPRWLSLPTRSAAAAGTAGGEARAPGFMRPAWAAGVLIPVLVGIGIALDRIDADRQQLRVRGQVQSQLERLSDRLHAQLTADLQLVRGLAGVVTLAPDIDQARFERAVQPLLDARTHLRNVAAAPDMVVRMVSPLAGNEQVLGLDYLRTPGQTEAAVRARDTRQVVLAGPLRLVQGGEGLIVRLPVYLPSADGERFWGLVSSVFDSRRLLADAGLTDPALTIRVALRGVDGRGASGPTFFGDATLFDRHPLLAEVPLPGGAWQMAAEPVGGWDAATGSRLGVRAGYALAAALVLASFVALSRGLATVSAAREQAESARRQLSAVLEGAPDAMLLVDEQGRIALANPQAAQLFGMARERLHGLTVEQLLPVAQRKRHVGLREGFLRSDRGGAPYRTSAMVALRTDGTEVPIEIMLSPLQVDGRRMIAASLRDITERRAVEAELERHRTQLERLVEQRTAQLAAAKDAAEAANIAKTQFLANVSHEIRTPLNAISGMAYLLRRTGVSDEQRERLDTLESASRHLMGVIDAILDLSKIEAGRLELAQAELDPADVVRQVAALERDAAAARGLSLTLDLPDDLPPLRGDAVRLQQALLNYAANAVRFTAQGGVTVGVRVQAQDAARCLLRFEVRDTGPGVDAATLARLFRPFEQADNTSTRRHGGTGLGLVITRRLAELMGGEAGADSRPGEGSCFWFTAWLERVQAPASAPGPARAEAHARPGRRVLLVEDDAVNRTIATHLLRDMGHGVDTAEDGEEALALAARAGYDLILMDVQMPRMDGLEATRRIRALPAHGGTAIIAITANAFQHDRDACLAAGMNGFVTKPIDPAQLRELIDRLARLADDAVERTGG